MQYLIDWKKKNERKPLIIKGARQVEKTWLMREFGKRNFSQTAYLNFESSKFLKDLFKDDLILNGSFQLYRLKRKYKSHPKPRLLFLMKYRRRKEA